ncbi:MAG: ABC transporter permease [Victivallales bacterium]|nr:ABC transporter permease [Victivallales bacterium]
MSAFLAIVKLTCRSALRSRVFQLLLALLVFTVIALPVSVVGDGTAHAHIQVSLKYCLGTIGFLLSLSTIWLGCFAMGADIESYQIHMVVTKPVSRLLVWAGKFAGIVMVNGSLLAISSVLVYSLVLWQFNKRSFTESEKSRIRSEILVGRRVFMPELPDTRSITDEIYNRHLEEAAKQGKKMTETEKRYLRLEISKRVTASMGEVLPGQNQMWLYKGLNKKNRTPVFLRYRVFVGKVSSKEQRETMGIWATRIHIMQKETPSDPDGTGTYLRSVFSPRTNYPETIMCGVFNEIVMSPMVIDEQGNVVVAFSNFDPQRQTLFFQAADGPKILTKVTGFLGNYIRGVFVIFIKICFLGALSCSIGGFLSIPVAIFSVFGYLLLGFFSSYLIGIDRKMASMGATSGDTFIDTLGNAVSRFLMFLLVPMEKFEVSSQLADGELIEYSYIGNIIIFNVFLKCAVILALGLWIYRRRELGLVVRK